MPPKKEGFDDIFAPTAEAKPAPKRNGRRAPAAKAPEPVAEPGPCLSPDPCAVLYTAWRTHEHEALYRKGKEDRILVAMIGLLAAITLGAAFALGAGRALDWHWIAKLIFRLFFVGAAFGVAFAGNALIELNRKRLQDVLAMIVKIQETLGLFADRGVPGCDGAFFPNTYKFVGSMNDDETNYAQMILKVAAGAAMFAILLLA